MGVELSGVARLAERDTTVRLEAGREFVLWAGPSSLIQSSEQSGFLRATGDPQDVVEWPAEVATIVVTGAVLVEAPATELTARQADGLACVGCGRGHEGRPMRPVGYYRGCQVFAHLECTVPNAVRSVIDA